MQHDRTNSGPLRWRAAFSPAFIAGLALSLGGGCAPSSPTAESNDYFTTWLEGHGASNVVVDAEGVGFAGHPIRLRYAAYQVTENTNGFVAELEFRVRLADGREIVDYVAGLGDTAEQAEHDAQLNFTLTTFHVIYQAFMDSGDPHQTEQQILIDGRERTLVMGDTLTRGETATNALDLVPVRTRLPGLLVELPLTDKPHWIKIIYAQHHSQTVTCAVTLDNEDSPELTEAVRNLPWPVTEQFYLAKQFLVVK